MDARTIIIGLDGVPFGMIEDFTKNGVMPNTAELLAQGLFKKMESSIPEVSSVAWSSMITGTNPGQHGTFGFMDLFPDSYKMKFQNYNDLKQPPFWDQWDGKSIIINVPSTYPVREMNGVLISGFVSIDFAQSIYPPSLVPLLRDLDYRLDVDARKAHTSMDLFLEDVDKTLTARIEAYRYLWSNYDWQTFMLVFTGTDRLMHFLWDAYEDKNHKYHNYFLDHFRKIDHAVGEIVSQARPDDLLVMHSDHGFERLDYDIYPSHLLAENGFLQFKDGQERELNNICYGTKAFVLDPARIHLNFKGKYPAGSVDQADAETILLELESLFAGLEVEGREVIRDVYRKEHIYSGACMDSAPEMVLVANEGFNLKAGVKSDKIASKAIFTGKHTQDTAFLLIKGLADETIVGEAPKVSDIKLIIEKSKSPG